jgi:tetratricopeptide (TPR) repeat protein
LFSLLLIAAAAQSVCAESVGQVVNEGNKLYRQGQYKEAINEYDKAATRSPEIVEPRFNKADGYFRLGDLQQAIDLYKAVAAESKDMQLVEKAKYNLGNCFFQQGVKLKDSDAQKAVDNMQSAIGWWRQTLDINPADEKAAKNIEVARLTIKNIIDQINKQKQQQKQTQEDLKKLLEQQKSLADKTQQAQQQPSPDYNDIAKEQSALKNRTEQVKQQMQQQNAPNNPDQKQQQAAEKLEKATDKQKDAAEKLKNSDAAGGKQSQDEAAKDIEKALKSLSDQQNQNQQQKQQENQQQNSQQQKQQKPNQPQEPNQAQQQEQQEQQVAPDTTAEEILDREQKQKEQRQMLQSPGFQKVDKDW